MHYNTSQKKLIMPEYGRHVHEMIQHAIQIKEREQRNNAAYTIIGIMGTLMPHLRDVPDFKHKLWNHLLIMSDYQLDIDVPFPPPPRNEMVEKPCRVPYPQSHIRQRHYGKILVEMIRETGKLEDSNKRDSLISMLVTQMRKSHVTWSRSEFNNEYIIQDVLDISDGKIQLNSEMSIFTDPPQIIKESVHPYQHHGHSQNHKKKKKKSNSKYKFHNN